MKENKIKLADILIIISIIIIIISIFLFSFKKYKVDLNDSYIEIIYKNEVVVKTQVNEEAEYEIKSSDDLKNVLIYKNDILIKSLNITVNDDFYNIIIIKDGVIHMDDASCKNKDCMKTEINETHTLPIICTNGVTIKVVSNDDIIDDFS